MSTKSRIYSGDGWWLEEEMITDQVYLCGAKMTASIFINNGSCAAEVFLSPEMLDSIAEIHAKKGLPHQRGK